ncbi:Methyltransferase type 11 [Penicillium robsamsonii]|uniref:Methyltransferase type 11 n=1 Tax=Penicillium robsamsonii TaxID=1792511 RepID=UPI002546E881|nr:Methyltransferase type 11 [Penicillium robsamsonii]KAJ5816546.1 Methyltransferase type 11 [Penicillium robsamsonii]
MGKVAAASQLPGMDTSSRIFAQDDEFWDNYSRGRPQVPDTFWDRIWSFHETKGGAFDTVHDIGAGNGPYAQLLRSRFANVIVSDIVADNIGLAQDRLRGQAGFAFRTAALEDADDIPAGSIDMVFAANVMHFAEPQHDAMETIARQLRSGGTFVASLFGPARFRDAKVQDLWERLSHQGGRELLRVSEDPDQVVKIMARTQDQYNVAPLDRALFGDEVRIHVNMEHGGIQGMLPPEFAHWNQEPDYGAGDHDSHEEMEGWTFETDLQGVTEHFGSFPFISRFSDALADLFQELNELLASEKTVKGYFPVMIILATRK